ncbi:hypothetical protein ACMGDK_11495 [Chryseobacterium sp. DT-3]|uniref:hypothetical protein n=1 Tax=Chryseobacterium sp. DT-3 TaxID=3396164 RepID=UPI003F1AFA56
MTNDINTNLDTTPKSTEVEKGCLLKATGIEITPNGILYSISPLSETCLLRTLDNIKEKDLILSCWITRKGQSTLFFRTNQIHPMVYSENKIQYMDEGLNYSIYNVGDYIAEVAEVFN